MIVQAYGVLLASYSSIPSKVFSYVLIMSVTRFARYHENKHEISSGC